jgi:predicted double-glycine peptidase
VTFNSNFIRARIKSALISVSSLSAPDIGGYVPRRIKLTAAMVLAMACVPATAATLSLKEIREAGVVIQQWDTSCAAAALATVFTYGFADPVTEREVAGGLLRQTEPLKVRYRGGFSMLDMKRYASERGYRATGFRGMEFEDIRYFDVPIIPVNFHGYNHYVVFRGMTPDGQVRIADPAYGNRTLSREKFEAAWIDGIAFVMLENIR